MVHVSKSMLCNMMQKGVIENLNVTKIDTSAQCKNCILRKHAQQPFNVHVNPEVKLYEQVTFDM